MDFLRFRIPGRVGVVLAGLVVALSVVAPSAAQAQASDTSAQTVALVDEAEKIVLPGKLPGVVAAPWDLAVTSNAVWVLEPRAGLVFRVAPSTNRVVARVKLPGPGCVPGTCEGVDRIVGDGRDVWVIDNQAKRLVHIDARTNKTRGSIPMTKPTFLPLLAVSGGLWWAPDPASGDISFVDAATGKVTKTAHVGVAPAFPVAMVGETLWASSSVHTGPGTPPEDALYHVDPETAEVTATIPGLSGIGTALDADFWLNRLCCPSVTHVDGTTGAPVADVPVDGFSDFLAAGNGSVWVRLYSSDMSRHWIVRVDPGGASTEQFELPTTERTGGLGVGFGSLWITNWNENAIYRMPTGRPMRPRRKVATRGRMWATAAAVIALIVSGSVASATTDVPHRSLSEIATGTVILPGDSPGIMDTPMTVAATDAAIWVALHRAGRVDRIDPRTNKVVASIETPTPLCRPGACNGLQAIAASRRDVWVFNDEKTQLVHINARTNRVVGSVPTTGYTWSEPVIDGDAVWAALSHSGDIERISARTHAVTKTVHVDAPQAWPIAIVDGALRVGSHDPGLEGKAAEQLHRVDLKRGTITKTVTGVTGVHGRVVGDDLWLLGCSYLAVPDGVDACPSVHRVDGRTGAHEADVTIQGFPWYPVAIDDHTLAINVDGGPNTPMWISIIDTRHDAEVAAYDRPFAEFAAGMTYAAGSLWVADWSANTVTRVEVP